MTGRIGSVDTLGPFGYTRPHDRRRVPSRPRAVSKPAAEGEPSVRPRIRRVRACLPRTE